MNQLRYVGLWWCGFVALTGSLGCATQSTSTFYWGDYEKSLYRRYAEGDAAYVDVYLLETIRSAEQRQLRLPPGVYADYGFLLYKRGDYDGALAYFEKEKRLFPESTALMAKLIERIQQQKTSGTDTNRKENPAKEGGS